VIWGRSEEKDADRPHRTLITAITLLLLLITRFSSTFSPADRPEPIPTHQFFFYYCF
jgi:hypothetical protein